MAERGKMSEISVVVKRMNEIENRPEYRRSCDGHCGGMGCNCPSPFQVKEYVDLERRYREFVLRGTKKVPDIVFQANGDSVYMKETRYYEHEPKR